MLRKVRTMGVNCIREHVKPLPAMLSWKLKLNWDQLHSGTRSRLANCSLRDKSYGSATARQMRVHVYWKCVQVRELIWTSSGRRIIPHTHTLTSVSGVCAALMFQLSYLRAPIYTPLYLKSGQLLVHKTVPAFPHTHTNSSREPIMKCQLLSN